MTTETWVVDGVNLSDLAYDIVTFDGLDDTAPAAGNNMAFAQTHGQKWVPKYFDQANKTITMFVSTKDNATGNEGIGIDGKRVNYDANLDKLVLLFGRRRKLLTVVRTLSNGSVRQASAECVASIVPSTVGLAAAKVAFTLNIPSGFWEDQSSSTLLTTAPASNVLFAQGATAPMADLTYAITGPITNPQVTDVETGSYFQYAGTIAAGVTATIKNSDMTATNATANLITHIGNVNWLTHYPTVGAGGAQVTFSGSGTTGATQLVITGKKKYLR